MNQSRLSQPRRPRHPPLAAWGWGLLLVPLLLWVWLRHTMAVGLPQSWLPLLAPAAWGWLLCTGLILADLMGRRKDRALVRLGIGWLVLSPLVVVASLLWHWIPFWQLLSSSTGRTVPVVIANASDRVGWTVFWSVAPWVAGWLLPGLALIGLDRRRQRRKEP